MSYIDPYISQSQQELYGLTDAEYALLWYKSRTWPKTPIPFTLDGLRGSLHVMGGPGSGKSAFLGWVFLPYCGYCSQKGISGKGIPAIVFCPPGAQTHAHYIAAVEARFSRLYRQGGWRIEELREARDRLLDERVLIIDMSAKAFGRVIPFPVLRKLFPDESWSDVADRIIQLFLDLSPQLVDAPVRGEASLTRTARQIFLTFSALHKNLIHVHRFLYAPWEYRAEIESLKDRADEWEVHAACEYLLDDFIKNARKRKTWEIDQLTGALAAKLPLFFSDDATVAFFNGEPGFNIDRWVKRKGKVFLDYSEVKNETMLGLTMNWTNRYFGSYFAHRGSAGHDEPIAYVVDELAALANFSDKSGSKRFLTFLDNQIQTIGRNYGIINVFAHQSQQFDPKIFNALMGMGTQVIGNIQDFDLALQIAKQLGERVDPKKVKHINYTYLNYSSNTNSWLPYFRHLPIENGAEYYSLDEQWTEQAYEFMDLPPLHFKGRFPQYEGDRTAPTVDFPIHPYITGAWPQPKRVHAWEKKSMERHGRVVGEVVDLLRHGSALPVARVTDEASTKEPEPSHKPHHSKSAAAAQAALAAFDAAFEKVKKSPPESKYLPDWEPEP